MLFNFTIEGNLAADPQIRYTPKGNAVCELRLIRNSRYRRDGTWVDGRILGLTLTCWQDLAERASELRKGDTVIAEVGDDLRAETYEGRAYLRATARTVAVSMRWHPAVSKRATRTDDANPGRTVQQATGGYDTTTRAATADNAPPPEPDTQPGVDAEATQQAPAPASVN
jgi:single-strand DNA-binding protein